MPDRTLPSETVVLWMSSESEGSESLSSLKILQASNLNLLQSFVEPAIMSDSSLITLEQLKHIHLEHCPRLEKIFPCSLSLPALETRDSLLLKPQDNFLQRNSIWGSTFSTPRHQKYLPPGAATIAAHPWRCHVSIWITQMGKALSPRLPIFSPSPTPEEGISKVKGGSQWRAYDWWDKLQMTLPEQSGYYAHVPAPEFYHARSISSKVTLGEFHDISSVVS